MNKKRILIRNWNKACDELYSVLIRRTASYCIVHTMDYGRVMCFHSQRDGSPNWKMIDLFMKRMLSGEVDRFLCCNPERIPLKYRQFHIWPDAAGEILSDSENSYQIGNGGIWVLRN